MFYCTISQGHAQLFRQHQLLLSHPLASCCFEDLHYLLWCTIMKRLFIEDDGEALAEVKTVELYSHMQPLLPSDLEFQIEEKTLLEMINTTMQTIAQNIFTEYCGQQLYIQTLHAMLGAAQARDGP